MASIPFYADWTFWQWVVSLTALVFAVGPQIRHLIRGPKLRVETYGRINLRHSLGNANVNLFLMLTNTGGRPVRILTIQLRITRDRTSLSLPGASYFPGTDETSFILTPFRLAAGKDWPHSVHFFEPFPREDERLYRQIVGTLREDIRAKKALPENHDRVVEADPAHVAPLMRFFDRYFQWIPGEYAVEVAVTTEPPKYSASTKLRMTLFETDSNELRSYTDTYKLGLGVFFFDAKEQPGVYAPLIPQ